MKLLFSLLSFFFFLNGFAAEVKVGIAIDVKECTFIAASSDYTVTNANHQLICTVKENQSVRIVYDKNYLKINCGGENITASGTIYFESDSLHAFFRLKVGSVVYPYDNALQINQTQKGFTAINIVEEEKYVAAVVESEAGNNINLEFLKVQAVLVRTFVESHLDRHASQGFMICDNVHCQVYRSRFRFNKEIALAIESTRGKIIADQTGKVISAAYHSNCGGQTMEGRMLWMTNVSYLQSVQDSFCVKSSHSNWEITIDRIAWKKYLGTKLNCLIYDDMPDSAFEFSQEVRKGNLFFEGKPIALKTIRNDWKLKSTFFNIIPQGEKILIRGKGYGHGVGLCQEGAIQMAKSGFTMEEILNFYFTNTHLAVKNR